MKPQVSLNRLNITHQKFPKRNTMEKASTEKEKERVEVTADECDHLEKDQDEVSTQGTNKETS